MNYVLTRTGDDAVLALDGQFNALAAQRLRALTSLLHLDAPRALTIDFAKVSFLGSGGLGVLLLLRKEMQKLGGQLTLLNMSDDVRKVFDISGLAPTFGL